MIKNYVLVAWRNILKKKAFSIINIIGLSLGLAASMIIYLIVSYEMSFDKYVRDKDRIYRVTSSMKFPGMNFDNAGIPVPLILAAPSTLTGIDLFAPISTPNGEIKVSISVNQEKPFVIHDQQHIVYTNEKYLELFEHTWLAGNKNTALREPFAAVLTLKRSRDYFGIIDPKDIIGKTITYQDSIPCTVTGIIADKIQNSDFTFEEYISYTTLASTGLKNDLGWDEWGSVSSANQLLIKLSAGTFPGAVTKGFQELFNKNQKDAYLSNTIGLQPLADVHYNSTYGNFSERVANKKVVYGLLLIACILLLLGIINFINLTTAQSVLRAKEIGVRKSIGSTKSQLIIQFLGETFLLTILATFLSCLLVPGLLKIFADFIPPGIQYKSLYTFTTIGFIISLVVLVSFLAGIYPAIILSNFKPVAVLKNHMLSANNEGRNVLMRKSLTLTQFVIAQVFVISSLLISAQIKYMISKDLGFKTKGVLSVRTPSKMADSDDPLQAVSKREVLLQKLKAIPEIEIVCLAGSPPATQNFNVSTIKYKNEAKEVEASVHVKNADDDFFKLFEMSLAAGRFPRRSDTISEYVINENLVKEFGFKSADEAIGKFLERGAMQIPIVGVIHDYYFRSLHLPMQSLAFYSEATRQNYFHIKLKGPNDEYPIPVVVSKIESQFKEIYPGEDFRYSFMEESVQKFYAAEQKTLKLVNWATGAAILISCLGMLGLIMYTTTQRKKEIGIRKIVGAGILQIIRLISLDFIKIILLALIIACPIILLFMNKWLREFAFHIQISLKAFLIGGGFMLIIATLTLAYQTIKAAIENPVHSIKNE